MTLPESNLNSENRHVDTADIWRPFLTDYSISESDSSAESPYSFNSSNRDSIWFALILLTTLLALSLVLVHVALPLLTSP